MNFDKENIKNNFSRNHNEYLIKANIQRKSAENLCEELLKKLEPKDFKKNLNILDLGAGTGFIADYLVEKLPKAMIYELDFSEKMMQKRPSHQSQIHQVIGDIDALNFPNNYFDIIISSFSLQWIENFQNLLKKIKNIGKNNLIFAFAIPDDDSFKNLISPFKIMSLPNSKKIKLLLWQENFNEILFHREIFLQKFSNPIEALKNFKEMGVNYNFYQNKEAKFNDFKFFKNFYLNNYKKNFIFNLDWSVSFYINKLC